MPIHRVPKGRLFEDVTSIEREGEVVVQVMVDPDDDKRFLVVTQWLGVRAPLETRGAA